MADGERTPRARRPGKRPSPRQRAETVPEADARGEIVIVLDGVPFGLRPSHAALVEWEAETGFSTFELGKAAESYTLKAEEMASIIAACIRAKARADGNDTLKAVRPQRIGELLHGYPGGALAVQAHILRPLLLGAVTGAYTPAGELKAGTATKTTTTAPA